MKGAVMVAVVEMVEIPGGGRGGVKWYRAVGEGRASRANTHTHSLSLSHTHTHTHTYYESVC